MNKIIKDWDNFWSSGHKDFTSEVAADINSDQAQLTFSIIKEFNPGSRILEAGCGLGNWVFIFSKMGLDAYGIDISKASLDVAYADLDEKGIKPKLLLSDIRTIPIKDGFFDLVVSYGAVEHFSDTSRALQEFFRVLKPGGACLITTPNPFSFHRIIGRHILNITKSQKLGYVGYEDAYTPRQLRDLLLDCGFKQVRYGILQRGFGCIFGCFWWGIPFIGKKMYVFLEKIAFFIQRKQNTFGGGSFAIGYKK